MAPAAPAPMQRAAVRFRVKNTFIDDIDECADEEQQPRLPRVRTAPLPRSRSGSRERAGSAVCSEPLSQRRSDSTSCGSGRSRAGSDDFEGGASGERARGGPGEAPAAPGAPACPRGMSIGASGRSLVVGLAGDACRARWRVDARRLGSSDTQVVSPPMEVSLRPGAPAAVLKLMLCPRGGGSFKKAGGVGQVQLKCCSDLPEGAWPPVAISVSVGSGRVSQASRGTFLHRFGSSAVFGAPREQADWDFEASVEDCVFTVTVEIALHA